MNSSEIFIRPPVAEDCEALYAAVRASMATLGRWMPWCHAGYARQDAQAWIDRCQSNWQSGSEREFVIVERAAGDVLGCAGINQINQLHQFGNLGYWVRADRTGHGLALAAARLVAQFAFRELKLLRLEIVVRVDNRASRRVAEKLGCQFECVARNRLLADGQAHHAALYSLLPSDSH